MDMQSLSDLVVCIIVFVPFESVHDSVHVHFRTETMSIDCNDVFYVRSKDMEAGNELSKVIRLANFIGCCAVTMAEKDRHVRVAPKTLRWNPQESAKSAQILAPRTLSGGEYSSAVRLELQFFSFGFCCPGKGCAQCYLSLLLPFLSPIPASRLALRIDLVCVRLQRHGSLSGN